MYVRFFQMCSHGGREIRAQDKQLKSFRRRHMLRHLLVRWATGKRLTDRLLPKLSLITLTSEFRACLSSIRPGWNRLNGTRAFVAVR